MPDRMTEYADFVSEELRRLKPNGLTTERISRTRLKVSFEMKRRKLQFRILMFAVGETGRGRPDERRVEITSTYIGGLDRDVSLYDVVLGIERDEGYFVGIDAERLNHGGSTSNASTFVYTSGFDALRGKSFDVMLNPSQLIPDERQVYMRPSYLIQYLANLEPLHRFGIMASGAKSQDAPISPDDPKRPNSHVRLSFEEQVRLALLKIEVGQSGERLAFTRERGRLSKAGKIKLAKRVNWISQTRPYVGYDIASFANSGSPHAIEVKSSTGLVTSFFFSNNELRVAEKKRTSYSIICVSNVFATPTYRDIIDPAAQIESGALKKVANGYVVTI